MLSSATCAREVEKRLAGIVGLERLLGHRLHLRDMPLDDGVA